jgi:hypothetical protein
MKKLLPFLLLLSLLLCACSSAGGSIAPLPGTADPTAAPSQEPAPQITSEPAPAPAATPEPVVIYDAYCKIGSYDDSLSNHWDYVLRIPAIQAPGSDATRLNQEMYTALYPYVKDALDAMESMVSLGICGVDYKVYVNDSLISIVSEVDTDWGFESYYTVNYDAESKTEVDRAALLARFGLDEEGFLALAVQTVDKYFKEHYDSPNIPKDSFWQDRYDKSAARENFTQDCQLYVNDQGQLCMIFKLYSFAGADYYYQILPLR